MRNYFEPCSKLTGQRGIYLGLFDEMLSLWSIKNETNKQAKSKTASPVELVLNRASREGTHKIITC